MQDSSKRMKSIRYEGSKKDALKKGKTETERRDIRQRRRLYPLNGVELMMLLRKYFVLPDDVQLKDIHYDVSRDSFLIGLMSENFDEVPEGQCAPVDYGERYAIRQ